MSEENQARRRSGRTTAGNRMQVVLAEMALHGPTSDGEDDLEFEVAIEESDVFESDFQSTDEESSPKEDAPVLGEDKKRLRGYHSKLMQPAIGKRSKKVSLSKPQSSPNRKLAHSHRQSTRRSTVLNSKETSMRVRDAESRRAAALRPRKSVHDAYKAQDALIKWALDMEESNINAHKTYLEIEEAKRAKATAIHRTAVSGARLRWISKSVEVQHRPGAEGVPQLPAWLSGPHGYYAQYAQYGQYTPAALQYNKRPRAEEASKASLNDTSSHKITNNTPLHTIHGHPVATPPATPVPYYTLPSYYFPIPSLSDTQQNKHSNNLILGRVARNFLVHDTIGDESTRDGVQPQSKTHAKAKFNSLDNISWSGHMSALFGTHVDWSLVPTLQVRTHVQGLQGRCPFTGQIACYRDPRTHLPFADALSYQKITSLLTSQYTWEKSLGVYMSPASTEDCS